jgi:uncharacterized protein YcsI (UPF0317 family)
VAEKEDCVLHRRAVRGDVVTFTYDFTTRQSQDVAPHHATIHDGAETHERSASARSVPSNPVVFRIRDDMSWEDVLQNSSHPVRHLLNGKSVSRFLLFIDLYYLLIWHNVPTMLQTRFCQITCYQNITHMIFLLNE